jgi:RNA polymerase sigma-70 factor, ECF subfamily
MSTVEAATVAAVETTAVDATPALDPDTVEWLRDLRGNGARHEDSVARLHALLLRASRFEVRRREASLPYLRGSDLDDLAMQAADDALVSVLARLDDFRGASRFSTWAYKFALLEAAVKMRTRAWQDREVPLEAERWDLLTSAAETTTSLERRELLTAVQEEIASGLTTHQRRVLVALALNEVPIDVLAERLGTTRGALYKTLHDARRKLRSRLEQRGFALDTWEEASR